MKKKIIILGGGPTGLGCAWRLKELGFENFHLFEANDYVGGLSASFKDEQGFTWDVGGHVLFSHYKYFDDLFEKLTEKKYLKHIRESWIRIADRFIPYPFQNNLRYLPPEMLWECLQGLLHTGQIKEKPSKNFKEWILEIFGEGVAKHFMFPYNLKTWAYPLEKMSKEWIAERVSIVDFERVLKNVIFQKDDVSWGPNNTFKFPEYGGTGAIYRAFLPHLEGYVSLNKKCCRIDTEKREIYFEDGSSSEYDILINTSPLDKFLSMMCPGEPELVNASKGLVSTSGIMLGLGFSRPCPSDKCWMYFPEDNSPIYRLTYFSNYSQKNAPDENHFSIMGEISYSDYKKLDKTQAINDFIQGMINTGIIREEWKKDIVSTSVIDVPYSYPVPSIGRNAALSKIIPALKEKSIHSRGRFGLWLYEIGNMDHSVMQGVELADSLLDNGEEPTIAPYKFLNGGQK
jgi:protoporphyrinogen oxidase